MELHNIPHKTSYRKIKYPRIELTTGELHLILPQNFQSEEIFQKHKKWILKKMEFIEECLKESSKKDLVQREEDEYKGLVLTMIIQAANELNVRINNVYFKAMKTKWASFSANKNVVINKLARYLPDYLLEYIVFHEITHIKQKRHNEKFWGFVSKKFANFPNLEKDLFIYWFKLAPELRHPYDLKKVRFFSPLAYLK
jgi:hypothetical protein